MIDVCSVCLHIKYPDGSCSPGCRGKRQEELQRTKQEEAYSQAIRLHGPLASLHPNPEELL